MWIILISLAAGILIGLIKIIPKKAMKYNIRIQQVGIVLLIFTMGASIGSNRDIFSNLESMGIEALVFAVLTSLLSIIAVYLISTKFIKDGSKK